MWTQRLGGGAVSASPVIAGGNIYVTNERGTTFVFQANPQRFVSVGRNRLGTAAFATPTISTDRIYHRTAEGQGGQRQEYLYCIGK